MDSGRGQMIFVGFLENPSAPRGLAENTAWNLGIRVGVSKILNFAKQ
jgi:hypothetical protein